MPDINPYLNTQGSFAKSVLRSRHQEKRNRFQNSNQFSNEKEVASQERSKRPQTRDISNFVSPQNGWQSFTQQTGEHKRTGTANPNQGRKHLFRKQQSYEGSNDFAYSSVVGNHIGGNVGNNTASVKQPFQVSCQVNGVKIHSSESMHSKASSITLRKRRNTANSPSARAHFQKSFASTNHFTHQESKLDHSHLESLLSKEELHPSRNLDAHTKKQLVLQLGPTSCLVRPQTIQSQQRRRIGNENEQSKQKVKNPYFYLSGYRSGSMHPAKQDLPQKSLFESSSQKKPPGF